MIRLIEEFQFGVVTRVYLLSQDARNQIILSDRNLLAVDVFTDGLKVMLESVGKVCLWMRSHQHIPIFVEQSEVPVAE